MCFMEVVINVSASGDRVDVDRELTTGVDKIGVTGGLIKSHWPS